VTAPVTILLVVVGRGVVVRLLHSLQKSQELMTPSLVTAVAHHEDPSKLTHSLYSLGDEEEAPEQICLTQFPHLFMLPPASVLVAHQALFPVAW